MSLAAVVVVIILLIPLILVAAGRLRLDFAGILTAVALGMTQSCGIAVLGPSTQKDAALLSLSGVSQPVTAILFSLIVVTRALEKTGIARWLARHVVALGRNSERRLILLLACTGAFLSLFMNTLAAGALMLPSAIEVSRRTKIAASKFLIPVAYGSCLGGAATYFTTSNIIASDMLRAASPPQAPLHILDFTPVGGLMAVAGLLFLWFFGPIVLPVTEPSAEQQVARRTGTELEATYEIQERLWDGVLPLHSPLAGRPLRDSGIGARLGITVLAVLRGKQRFFAPAPDFTLHSGDHLLIVGHQERVMQLDAEGIDVSQESRQNTLSASGARFVELVLIPHSKAEGQTLKELAFRSRFGLTAVAIRRDGRSYRTDVAEMPLRQGDSILVVGSDTRFRDLARSSDFLMIETDSADRPTDWPKAAFTLVTLAIAIIGAIAGFPVYLSMLSVATAIVLGRVLSMEEIYRSMEWHALILIAGMYPLSLAIIHTGLADRLGALVVEYVQPYGALGLVAGAFILTGALSQIVAGQVTTLITAPVFISAAIRLGVNPQAVAVASALACSTTLLTPLSHPVNALMIGAGNYRFRDFFRAGWIITILSFLMLLLGMRLFWGI
ncbi:MAG: SLC13 family permease [Proteobacteria bacterium]|nr:SLC13 family permease [Pseudomonadota bacterium]